MFISASILLSILLFSGALIITTAEPPVTGTILFEGEVEAGWSWVEARCTDGQQCTDMRLQIENGSTIQNITDRFFVEWLEEIPEGWLKLTLFAESATVQQSILNGTVEAVDAPDNAPISSGDNMVINATGCNLISTCSEFTLDDATEWHGVLNDTNDIDILTLASKVGDVFEISVESNRNAIVVEAWTRLEQQPLLLNSIDVANQTERDKHIFFSASETMVWLKIRSDGIDDLTPYSIQIARHLAAAETASGESPANSPNLPVHQPSQLAGHLALADSGDSLLLAVGAGLGVNIECTSTSPLNITILTTAQQTTLLESNLSACPLLLEVPQRVDSLEVRFSGHKSDLAWQLTHSIVGKSDGVLLGDSPSVQWTNNSENNRSVWPWISGTMEGLGGGLSNSDDVDIWMIELTTDSWLEANLHTTSTACCKLEIINLTQENGAIIESKQDSANLSAGVHAIRISANGQGEGIYSFDVRIMTQEPSRENESFQDLSALFRPFYIFIGFLMLSPWIFVAYWGITGQNRIEDHELMRLNRLRERLLMVDSNTYVDQKMVDSALRQLGDADWDALILEWGKPLLRHSTTSVEMVVWTLSSDRVLLIGLNIGPIAWKHAALRLASSAGESVKINAVHPSQLHFEDEIDLGVLSAKQQVFLRIETGGNSEAIDINLSGVVDGEPMAATASRAIHFEEE